MTQIQTKKIDIVVTRLIDAPVERVWKAWTDPKLVMQWWGPQYYSSALAKIDLREGGNYVFGMTPPKDQGGQDSYTSGIYKKIIAGERLEFTQGLSDKDGNRIDPSKIGMPADFPKEIRTEVVFKKARCDMTELMVTEHDWTPSQMYVYSIAGLQQSIDKLVATLNKT
jgi:uncharacterized protein YndB with AHSA1/START domain